MPPPGTYVDITTSPQSNDISAADFNAGTYGGVAEQCWFRFVTTVQIALGGYCTATLAGVDFVASTRIYQSDGTTLLHTINPGGSESNSWFFVFTAGTYYIKITNQYATPIAHTFTASYETKPILEGSDLERGDIIINDDASGKPATVYDSSGEIRGILPGVPSGEIGAVLPSGYSLWHDSFGYYGANKLAIFDADMAYVTSVDTTTTLGANQPLMSHDATKFFVYHTGDRKIYSVTTSGTVTAATSALSNVTRRAFAVSRDGKTAYYALGSTDGIIYQYDIENNTTAANLYTISGFAAGSDRLAYTLNNFPGDILVLSDGTIVTSWRDVSAATSHLLHLTEDGTLLKDLDFTDSTDGWIDHISYDPTSPTSRVRVWFQDITYKMFGTFVSVSLMTGTKQTIIPQTVLFEDGVALFEGIDTKFAPSQSCTMLSFGTSATTTPTRDYSIPCCPCDCPVDTPSKPPVSKTTHTGPILDQVDVEQWSRVCSGNGVVPTAPDASDPESWANQ